MTEQTPQPFTIKQWAEDDRPREKLLLKGRSSLSDAELIAILIATGTREESAVDLSKKILSLTQNSLNKLGKLPITELKKIKGIGEAKAITIIAALELGRRRKEEEAVSIAKITCSRDSFNVFEPILSDLPHEEFWVMLLNRANKIIEYKRISEGGVSSTVVDPKIIFQYALQKLASSIVVCHNHPSGSVEPSDTDKHLTRKIKAAAALLDITVIDHIIIGYHNYYSFADEGAL